MKAHCIGLKTLNLIFSQYFPYMAFAWFQYTYVVSLRMIFVDRAVAYYDCAQCTYFLPHLSCYVLLENKNCEVLSNGFTKIDLTDAFILFFILIESGLLFWYLYVNNKQQTIIGLETFRNIVTKPSSVSSYFEIE